VADVQRARQQAIVDRLAGAVEGGRRRERADAERVEEVGQEADEELVAPGLNRRFRRGGDDDQAQNARRRPDDAEEDEETRLGVGTEFIGQLKPTCAAEGSSPRGSW
jgi:hypothetical protein